MKTFFLALFLAAGVVAAVKFTPALLAKRRTPAAAAPLVDKRSALEKQAGIVTMNIPNGSSQFQVSVPPRCGISDYDVITSELSRKPSTILFSIEPLDGKAPLFVEKMTTVILSSGVSKSVTFPQTVGNYGIFVCLDSTGEGRCLNKGVVSLNRAMEPASGKPHVDKIIYFQYVFFDGKATLHAFEDWKVTPVATEALYQFAVAQFPTGTPFEKIRKEINLVLEIERTLQSMKLTQANSTINVAIPKLDLKVCSKETEVKASDEATKSYTDTVLKFAPPSTEPTKKN